MSVSGNALIVGLGNPGRSYQHTRHNLGAEALEGFAVSQKVEFKRQTHLAARVARWHIEERVIFLVLPQTFMNNSGDAVKRALDFWKIPLERLLVVVDDVDLPFGEIRFREKGSSGGHKGLADIQNRLHSTDYARLRLGVDRPEGGPLESYVLDFFSEKEKEAMPLFLERAKQYIAGWCKGGSVGVQQVMSLIKQEKMDETR